MSSALKRPYSGFSSGTQLSTPPPLEKKQASEEKLGPLFFKNGDPKDLQLKICSFLPPEEQCNLALVSKKGKKIVRDFRHGQQVFFQIPKCQNTEQIRKVLKLFGSWDEPSKLEILNAENSNLTDSDLKYIAEGFPLLKDLKLSGSPLITDEGLAHVAEMPLRIFRLAACKQITNAGLARLSRLQLEELELEKCDWSEEITEAGLEHFARIPLQKLSIINCCNLTDAGLLHLVQMPLTHLILADCGSAVTGTGLINLLNRLSSLTHLRVLDCSGVTKTVIADLRKAYPQLQIEEAEEFIVEHSVR